MLRWITKVRNACVRRYRVRNKKVLVLLGLEVMVGLLLVAFLVIVLNIFL